jgi:hypothetical protein
MSRGNSSRARKKPEFLGVVAYDDHEVEAEDVGDDVDDGASAMPNSSKMGGGGRGGASKRGKGKVAPPSTGNAFAGGGGDDKRRSKASTPGAGSGVAGGGGGGKGKGKAVPPSIASAFVGGGGGATPPSLTNDSESEESSSPGAGSYTLPFKEAYLPDKKLNFY